MSEEQFERKYDRLWVATLTPFKENFEVDEEGLRRHLQYFMQPKFKDNISGGGIIINPEAGDLFYLSRKEKRRNVEIAVEECGGKMPVFAGVFDFSTDDAVKVAIDAKEAGAEGLFLFPPQGAVEVTLCWNPDQHPEVIVDFFRAEIKATGLPAIIHPVGPWSKDFGGGLPLKATMEVCRQIPNIVGWKMFQNYVGSVVVARSLRALDRHVAILPAMSNLFHENQATGYWDGALSGSFCYAMEPMVDHSTAWKNGDLREANRIWKSGLEDLQYYIDWDPGRLHTKYKAASWIRGVVPLPFMRSPQPHPSREECTTIRQLLIKNGLSVIPQKDFDRVVEKMR